MFGEIGGIMGLLFGVGIINVLGGLLKSFVLGKEYLNTCFIWWPEIINYMFKNDVHMTPFIWERASKGQINIYCTMISTNYTYFTIKPRAL